MENFEHIPYPSSGYEIPEALLTGDFRSEDRATDPYYTYAQEYAARSQSGSLDPAVVEALYLEFGRIPKIYEHIQAQGASVPPQAYLEVTEVIQTRLQYILSGETDLHDRQ